MDETKILYQILKNNQWFDIFKMNGDIEQMMKSIYNMRIYHGQLIIMQYGLIQKAFQNSKINESINNKEFQKISKKISFIESTNESCKKLISDSENIVKNYILNNKFKELRKLRQRKPLITRRSLVSASRPTKDSKKTLKNPESIDTSGIQRTLAVKNIDISNSITCIAGTDKPTIVNFYVKWCKYSSAFIPVWKNISTKACSKGFNVLAIDCDEKKRFCKQFGIVGFPCVRLLANGRVIEFTESRTEENLTKFILQHTNIKI